MARVKPMELPLMSFTGNIYGRKLQIILKEYIRDVEDARNILIKSLNDSQDLNLKNKYDFLSTSQAAKRQSLRRKRNLYDSL